MKMVAQVQIVLLLLLLFEKVACLLCVEVSLRTKDSRWIVQKCVSKILKKHAKQFLVNNNNKNNNKNNNNLNFNNNNNVITTQWE